MLTPKQHANLGAWVRGYVLGSEWRLGDLKALEQMHRAIMREIRKQEEDARREQE